MSKKLLKAVQSARKGNKVPIKRTITRGGKTYQQTYWVSPQQAKKLREKMGKQKEGFDKSSRGVMDRLRPHEKLIQREIDEMRADPWFQRNERDILESPEKLRAKAEERVKNQQEWEDHNFQKEAGRALSDEKRDREARQSRQRGRFEEEAASALKQADKETRPWKQKSLGLPPPNPPNPFPERLDVDETALRDLDLFADNDAELYQKYRSHIERYATESWARREFDEKELASRFKAYVDLSVKKYMKEIAGVNSPLGFSSNEAYAMFPGDLRKQLARDMARRFTEALEAGEYGDGTGGHKRLKQAVRNLSGGSKEKKKGFKVSDSYHEEFSDGADSLDLSPEDLQDAYSAPDGYETSIEYVDYTGGWSGNKLSLEGNVYDANGEKVGDIERVISRDSAGDLHAYHSLFWFTKSELSKKTGVGTKMIQQQFENYESWGVSTVSLSAASVGKYLWMKLGFVPTDRDARRLKSRAERILDESDLEEPAKDRIRSLIQDKDLNTFARFEGLPEIPYKNPVSKKTEWAPFNKAVLLDDNAPGWNGTIEVEGDDWDNTMEILDGYINKD